MRRLFLAIAFGMLAGCDPTPPAAPTTSTPSPAAPPAAPVELEPVEPGFQRLTLDQFTPVKGEVTTWREEGADIVCTGLPKGYLHTKDAYENFTLRGEFQYILTEGQEMAPEKANTGFMLFIQEPHKVWPPSLEAQGRWDELCSLKSNGGIPSLTIHDQPEVRERVRKLPEEWNAVEIVAREGAVTARLNGELVCTSDAGELKSGFLGLQSEGYAVRFRNLRVRRDAAGLSAPAPEPAPVSTPTN
jgi:hypothetical protein